MLKFFVVLAMVAVVPAMQAAAPSLSRYRTVTLGDTVATVTERLQLTGSNVKVLYEHPVLVQEATWRPNHFVSGAVVEPDPLAEIVMTFYADRLARIVATYGRDRTQGLTDADLLELLSDAYGAPMLQSTHRAPLLTPTAPRHVIATWADDDARVLLWREDYPRLVGLTITATIDDAKLQQANVEAAQAATLSAPERERATQAAAAAAIKEREARIRLENKAKFKP